MTAEHPTTFDYESLCTARHHSALNPRIPTYMYPTVPPPAGARNCDAPLLPFFDRRLATDATCTSSSRRSRAARPILRHRLVSAAQPSSQVAPLTVQPALSQRGTWPCGQLDGFG